MFWQDREISEPCEIHSAPQENGDRLQVITHTDNTAETMLVSVRVSGGTSGVDLTFHPRVASVPEAKQIAEELYARIQDEMRAILAYAQTRWP